MLGPPPTADQPAGRRALRMRTGLAAWTCAGTLELSGKFPL